MNIHEHQAKAVLAEFGVAVPRGYPAFTVDEAVEAAKKLGGPVFVVKSQIHAGGRGKGRFEGLGPDAKGGVRVVKSTDDVKTNAAEMLGRTLVTIQMLFNLVVLGLVAKVIFGAVDRGVKQRQADQDEPIGRDHPHPANG